MNKYLLYGVVIICLSMSISIVIIYSNLLVYGLSFKEFLIAIFKTWEFYLLPLGIYFIIKDRF